MTSVHSGYSVRSRPRLEREFVEKITTALRHVADDAASGRFPRTGIYTIHSYVLTRPIIWVTYNDATIITETHSNKTINYPRATTTIEKSNVTDNSLIFSGDATSMIISTLLFFFPDQNKKTNKKILCRMTLIFASRLFRHFLDRFTEYNFNRFGNFGF